MRLSTLRRLALTVAFIVLPACAPGRYFDGGRAVFGPAKDPARGHPLRGLPMFAGHDGTAVAWADLMDAVAWADVVFLGEQHDDEVAHDLQREIVAETFASWRPCALSLEMLERDEQSLVSDYFDGIIDAEGFTKLTNSKSWGRDGAWERTYQTIIDAARTSNGMVIAANAPRRYVSLARREGYQRLAAVPSPRRELFDYPARLPAGGYRDRFWEVMQTAGRPEADDGDGEESEPYVMSDDEVEALFRSQLVWDATMAASIATASRRGAKKVVHLIGQFHTDFEGGTILELRKRLPGARVLVVSFQRGTPDALLDDDIGRADIVVYTGDPPEPADEEADDADEAADEGAVAPATTQPDEVAPASTQPEEVAPTTAPAAPPTSQPGDGSPG